MSRLYVAQALRIPPLQVGACVVCFFFGFFICLFVVLFGVLGRPEVQKISKSLWTSGLPSFRGERRRRRAHRGLQPCATLLELQLITVCRVHKQLAALRSVECPWGKLQGGNEIDTNLKSSEGLVANPNFLLLRSLDTFQQTHPT